MAISDRISAMYDHVGDIYDTLELGGDTTQNKNIVNINNEIKREYKDFLANGTDTLWNNWNKVNGTGESLTLNNTIKAKMKIDLKGNTSQDGEPTPDSPQDINVVSGDNSIKVEGKNLLPNTATTTTTNGITFTANEDGTISVSGTASSTAYLTYPTFSLSAGTYTLSAGIYVNQLTRIQLVEDITNRPLLASTQSSANQTFTTTATKRVFLQFRINSGEVINTTFKPMIEKGSTATEYEEHKEQNYILNLGSLELAKIGDYQDYIEGTPDNWVKTKVVEKIDSYNGETITTDYISTTGGLDTGARVYYVLQTPTEVPITNATLIEQLNNIYNNAYAYEGTTNIFTSCEEWNVPMIIEASALKGI